MDITKYKISNSQYLKINPDECIHDDECQFCARMDIEYIDEKNNICIKFGYEDAADFYSFLAKSKRVQKLLKGVLALPKNIINDLGFEFNQFTEGKQEFNDAFLEYNWLSNSSKRPYYDSWLYNDENGNIILEITPFYPWHNVTKKTCPNKISYKEWIKNYKPVVKTIISKENFKQWVKQADEFGKKYKLKF